MTSPDPAELAKRTRLTLILGKFRVTEVGPSSIKIALGGSTTMTSTIPSYADVREGDLLTFYTEVMFKPRST